MKKNIQPIRFPRDAQKHKTAVEWWYFNGNLKDAFGKKYSFMNCLFQVDPRKIHISFLTLPISHKIFFAHETLCDIHKKTTFKNIQPISIVSGDSFTRPLLYINYFSALDIKNKYINNEIAETSTFHFHVKTEHLDLSLRANKKPLLENGTGYIFSRNKGSYYYSLTDLSVQGTIRIQNKWIPVEGKAWMDHQWANTRHNKDEWNWFSFQLENGTDIMCVEYNNNGTKEYEADIIDAHGKQTHTKNVRIVPQKKLWRSKKTGASYPLTWHITIPEEQIQLSTQALLSNQEIIFGDINYWEGPLRAQGTIKGKKVQGVGFMELVRYHNYLKALGKEIGKSIHKLGL